MFPPHLINICIHILAGTLAILLGLVILFATKGTGRHQQLGKIFCYFTLIVCCSAITGLIFFRFLPVFAFISLLVLYQLVSGWRVAITRELGPQNIDAINSLLAIAASILLFPFARTQTEGKIIFYSTFFALAIMLVYDSLRWLFPKKWHRQLWPYEHSYKLLSALFGMLSAFAGNVIRTGQPWSQLIPSVLGTLAIGYFFIRRTNSKPSRS